jgi:hypothetical protein
MLMSTHHHPVRTRRISRPWRRWRSEVAGLTEPGCSSLGVAGVQVVGIDLQQRLAYHTVRYMRKQRFVGEFSL